MKKQALTILFGVLALSWASCQSVQTQSRMVISNPEDGSPPVIQIQSGNGEVRQVVPGIGDSTPEPAPSTPEPGADPASGGEQYSTPAPTPSAAGRQPRLVYNSIQTSEPVLAMTFDDGPHPELTPKLLDMLKERNLKATFFVIGKNVELYPEIARRIVAEGHEIANHSWSHPALPKIGAARVKSEIDKTSEIIERVTGVRPATMRPPYGATNQSLNRRLNEEFGLSVIMWSVDPQDWRYRNAARVSNHLIQHARPGDILLAHDIHPSTIAAMPGTFDALVAKGFRFLTVSELLARESPPPLTSTH